MSAIPFDWNFRPKGYFGVLDTKKRIANRIKGTMRRRAVKAALDENDPQSVPALVAGERLDEATRRAAGRLHPAMMGGEYLPDMGAREVEIARIELQSTTGDVYSIRAEASPSRIRYRVACEYEDQTFVLAIKSSARPLTLRQMVRLISKSAIEHDEMAQYGLALSHVVSNHLDGGVLLEELEGFVTVQSDFYPQLESVFDELISDWMLDQAFYDLSLTARNFLKQFSDDERQMLESEYGRPWHHTFQNPVWEIENLGAKLRALRRNYGPVEEGWFESIIQWLEDDAAL